MHLTQRLYQAVDVRNTRPWKPRRGAGRYGSRRGADSHQRLSDGPAGQNGEQTSNQESQQCPTRHSSLGPPDHVIDLLQPCGYPNYTWPSCHRDVQEWLANGITSPAGDPSAP
jgi:hypothetical protein